MTAPLHAKDEEGGRFYYHPFDSRKVPSITNIKGMKNFKAAKSVAAKDCASYVSKNVAKLATLDEDEVWRLVKGAPWAHDTEANIASRNGDIVHQWIDKHIQGGKVDPRFYEDFHTGEQVKATATAKAMWRSFLDFEKYYKPKWFRSEFTVWNDTIGYAGTMDWAAWINSALVLADNKSGKGVWPDMGIQLAAGAKAEFILNPDGSQDELPHFDRFGILHVRPRFWEFVPVANEAIEARWIEFKALKAVFDIENEWEEQTLLYTPKHQVRVNDDNSS